MKKHEISLSDYCGLLSNYCRWNEAEDVTRVLNQCNGIDLTYDDGIYFKFAARHSNVQMLNSLLDYHLKPEQEDLHNTREHLSAKHFKLRQIFSDIEKQREFSPEIQEVLDKRIPAVNDDSSSEQDIEDFGEDDEGISSADLSEQDLGSQNSEKNEEHYSLLTEENLRKHDNRYLYNKANPVFENFPMIISEQDSTPDLVKDSQLAGDNSALASEHHE